MSQLRVSGGVFGLGVALLLPVSVTGSLSSFLDVLLCLLPAWSPAAVHLCGSPVRFGRASEGTVILSDVARLFRQLVFIYEAALLLAGQFRVSPRLFLAGCKDPVEDHATVMYQGGDEEHVLPLLSGLGRSERVSEISPFDLYLFAINESLDFGSFYTAKVTNHDWSVKKKKWILTFVLKSVQFVQL